jgi:hypothetical protein
MASQADEARRPEALPPARADDDRRAGAPGPPSTLAGLTPGRRNRVDDIVRWAFIGVVALVLALGILGLLGPMGDSVEASGDGLALEVRYDRLNRCGLPATWEVAVRSTDGHPLPPEVELATTSNYFDLFDENGFSPQPTAETTGADDTTWTFETEPGSTELVVSLDARTQPGWHEPERGVTTLTVEGHEPLRVAYRTWLAP